MTSEPTRGDSATRSMLDGDGPVVRGRTPFLSGQSPGEARWELKYGGLLVALLGFAVTRLAVLPAVDPGVTLTKVIVGDILPLVLGLGITVVGISLTISTLPRKTVNTIAAWCFAGTVAMAIVAGLTVLQVSLYTADPTLREVWVSSLFANTLIAGAIGGLLIGVRTARETRHRRDLRRQSRQATLLNRLLRHEVLNKLAVIRGYATRLTEPDRSDDGALVGQIQRSSTEVQDAIDEIGFLTRIEPSASGEFGPVALDELIREEIEALTASAPDVTVDLERASTDPVHVAADSHLATVFRHLFENAVEYADGGDPHLTVSLDPHPSHVEIRVADDGPGLPADQRAILEEGEIPPYDDPATGFGLPIVRMLVSQYRGSIGVTSNPDAADGTAITISLPRADPPSDAAGADGVEAGVDPRRLAYAVGTALVAGVAMGAILNGLTDTLVAIGGLYGVRSMGVGWVLHLFHSAIFGLVFAAALSRPRFRPFTDRVAATAGLGVAYGVVLWLVATGLVMPVWLNLVGVPAAVPNLSLPSLWGHTAWGALLGGLYGFLTD